MIQGIVVVVVSLFMIRPPTTAIVAAIKGAVNPMTRRNFTPGEMLKTPVFWMLYVCMILVASGGLMAAAEVAPIAKDYGVSTLPINFLWATLPLLTVALSIDSLVNGLTRPLTGWISDHLGRENTMLLVFIVEGLAIWGLMTYGHNPAGFLIFAPLIFLGYGEIFSLFPAVSGDTFGPKYRGDQQRVSLHRQGHVVAADPARQCAQAFGRQLGAGALDCGRVADHCGAADEIRPEPDASPNARPGERRSTGKGRADRLTPEVRSVKTGRVSTALFFGVPLRAGNPRA